MIISQITPNVYSKKMPTQSKNCQSVTFSGGIPKPKVLINLEESIARGLGKIADTKGYEKLINSTNKHPSLVDKDKGLLFPHLIVLGSTMLSGFYVLKTLQNKQMDEDKRKTLAVNQGLVWAVSTVLAYTLDISVKKKFTQMLDKFKQVNKNMPEKELNNLVTGFKMAKSMIAVDLVYRFIAPVLVTPFANAIGNEMHEQRLAKKAAKKAALNKQA